MTAEPFRPRPHQTVCAALLSLLMRVKPPALFFFRVFFFFFARNCSTALSSRQSTLLTNLCPVAIPTKRLDPASAAAQTFSIAWLPQSNVAFDHLFLLFLFQGFGFRASSRCFSRILRLASSWATSLFAPTLHCEAQISFAPLVTV